MNDPPDIRAARCARSDPLVAPDEPHRFVFRPFHSRHAPLGEATLLLQRELATVGDAAKAVAAAWGLGGEQAAAAARHHAGAARPAPPPPHAASQQQPQPQQAAAAQQAAADAAPAGVRLVFCGRVLSNPDAVLWDTGCGVQGAVVYVLPGNL